MADSNGWDTNGHNLSHLRPVLGAPLSIVSPSGRENAAKLMTSIAMVGGGVYALMSIPGAQASRQIALGALGGGLLVASLINVYDVIA